MQWLFNINSRGQPGTDDGISFRVIYVEQRAIEFVMSWVYRQLVRVITTSDWVVDLHSCELGVCCKFVWLRAPLLWYDNVAVIMWREWCVTYELLYVVCCVRALVHYVLNIIVLRRTIRYYLISWCPDMRVAIANSFETCTHVVRSSYVINYCAGCVYIWCVLWVCRLFVHTRNMCSP